MQIVRVMNAGVKKRVSQNKRTRRTYTAYEMYERSQIKKKPKRFLLTKFAFLKNNASRYCKFITEGVS